MHVDILIKVWDQLTDDWDMHKGPHRDAHVCTQLCKGVELTQEARETSTCADTCTHSNQCVGPEKG